MSILLYAVASFYRLFSAPKTLLYTCVHYTWMSMRPLSES